jgi:glycosyltransferase involved in cell wall biosynthesis
MIIAIDNVNFESFTGPNRFSFVLGSALQSRGHEIVSSAEDEYDICLVVIEQANEIKCKAPMVQRLDGIWYHPDDFETKNEKIKETYFKADGLIFQSEWDKKMIEKHFGVRSVPKTVIRNGTYASRSNVKISWLENIKKDFVEVFAASSQWTNRPHKRLDEAIRFAQEYSDWANVPCCLITMGQTDKFSANTEIKYTDNFTQIHLGNVIPSQAFIPVCYATWFIHLAYHDHCPNVVVDALACQVPVICSSEGGTAELVRDRGMIIREEPFDFTLCDYKNPPHMVFTENHFKAIRNTFKLRKERVADTHIIPVAEQYYTFFENVINETKGL